MSLAHNMIPKLIIFGPPGSGKGTQSKVISKRFNIPVISTGDLLRNIASLDDDLSKKVSNIINSGGFVDDDLVLNLVLREINRVDCNNGFILDGFPRNINQANKLQDIVSKRYGNDHCPVKIINLHVTHDEVIKRITGRFICKKCGEVYNKMYRVTLNRGVCDVCGSSNFYIRQDDRKEVAQARLDKYDALTKPLIDYYDNDVIQIDGMKSHLEVSESIISSILTKY